MTPRGGAPSFAEGLTEATAGRPAFLATIGRIGSDHAVMNRTQRLVVDVAESRVDLLDAGRDIADVVNVEALHAGMTGRHLLAAQEGVYGADVVAEHPEVRVPLPEVQVR